MLLLSELSGQGRFILMHASDASMQELASDRAGSLQCEAALEMSLCRIRRGLHHLLIPKAIKVCAMLPPPG